MTVSNIGKERIGGVALLPAGSSIGIEDKIHPMLEGSLAHCSLREELELEKGKRQEAEEKLREERAKNSRRKKKRKHEISEFIASAQNKVASEVLEVQERLKECEARYREEKKMRPQVSRCSKPKNGGRR